MEIDTCIFCKAKISGDFDCLFCHDDDIFEIIYEDDILYKYKIPKEFLKCLKKEFYRYFIQKQGEEKKYFYSKSEFMYMLKIDSGNDLKYAKTLFKKEEENIKMYKKDAKKIIDIVLKKYDKKTITKYIKII